MELQTIAWLSRLPSGYRERALINYHKRNKISYPPALHYTIDDALMDAFKWSDTPEGKYFWYSVHKYLQNPNTLKLPPLPQLST